MSRFIQVGTLYIFIQKNIPLHLRTRQYPLHIGTRQYTLNLHTRQIQKIIVDVWIRFFPGSG